MTVTVRPATVDDISFVWTCRQELANSVARQSRSSENFTNHQKWLTHAVAQSDRIFLVVLLDGNPVGYVRFDPLSESAGWRVSLCISKSARGDGLGKAALAAGCQAADDADFWPQIADIHPTNTASERVFASCGFVPIDNTQWPDEFRRYARYTQKKELIS